MLSKFNSSTIYAPRKNGSKISITPNLGAGLDRTQVSDRQTTFVIAEAATGLGLDIGDLALSRSSIRVHRQKPRVAMSPKQKLEFQLQVPLVVHWNGKHLRDLAGKENVDRRLKFRVVQYKICMMKYDFFC